MSTKIGLIGMGPVNKAILRALSNPDLLPPNLRGMVDGFEVVAMSMPENVRTMAASDTLKAGDLLRDVILCDESGMECIDDSEVTAHIDDQSGGRLDVYGKEIAVHGDRYADEFARDGIAFAFIDGTDESGFFRRQLIIDNGRRTPGYTAADVKSDCMALYAVAIVPEYSSQEYSNDEGRMSWATSPLDVEPSTLHIAPGGIMISVAALLNVIGHDLAGVNHCNISVRSSERSYAGAHVADFGMLTETGVIYANRRGLGTFVGGAEAETAERLLKSSLAKMLPTISPNSINLCPQVLTDELGDFDTVSIQLECDHPFSVEELKYCIEYRCNSFMTVDTNDNGGPSGRKGRASGNYRISVVNVDVRDLADGTTLASVDLQFRSELVAAANALWIAANIDDVGNVGVIEK